MNAERRERAGSPVAVEGRNDGLRIEVTLHLHSAYKIPLSPSGSYIRSHNNGNEKRSGLYYWDREC